MFDLTLMSCNEYQKTRYMYCSNLSILHKREPKKHWTLPSTSCIMFLAATAVVGSEENGTVPSKHEYRYAPSDSSPATGIKFPRKCIFALKHLLLALAKFSCCGCNDKFKHACLVFMFGFHPENIPSQRIRKYLYTLSLQGRST